MTNALRFIVLLIACALASQSPALTKSSQQRNGSSQNAGVLGDLAEGAWKIVAKNKNMDVLENIIFVKWEIPGQIYTFNTISRNKRVTGIGRVRSDGFVSESSDLGILTGQIGRNGSLILQGAQRGVSVVEEIRRTSSGRISFQQVRGRSRFAVEIERVPDIEALQMLRDCIQLNMD